MVCIILARIKTFPKDFMKQFGDEHRAAVGIYNRLEIGGFPDTGNGFYADKLSYKSWFEFNTSWRTAANYVELLPVALSIFLVCGFIVPRATFYVSLTQVVVRPIYSFMYSKFGPNARLAGAILQNWSMIGLVFYSTAILIKDVLI